MRQKAQPRGAQSVRGSSAQPGTTDSAGRARWRRFLAAILVSACIVGACGDDGDTDADDGLGCRVITVEEGGPAIECDPEFSRALSDALEPVDRPVETVIREVPGSPRFLDQFDADELANLERTVAGGEYVPVVDEDHLRQLRRWAAIEGIDEVRITRVFQIPPVKRFPICRFRGKIPVCRP